MLGGLILLALAAGFGVLCSLLLPVRLYLEERVAVGSVIGLTGFAFTSLAVFMVAGMGWVTIVGGLAPLVAVATVGLGRGRPRLDEEWASLVRRWRLPARSIASPRWLVALTAASAVVSTRIMSLAYQRTSRGLAVGHLSGYGDWAAHLAYAGSFAYGDNRSFRSPLASGTPLRYHFLADWLSATTTVPGASLPQALSMGTWVIALLLPMLMWAVVRRVGGSVHAATLTVVLFVLSGGVGGWFVLTDIRRYGWSALTSLPHTYALDASRGLVFDNELGAALYAQRSTQLGLAIGLAAALLILAGRRHRSSYAVSGALIGVAALTFVHLTISAICLGALAALRERRHHGWRWFLSLAVLIGTPIALAIRPPTNSARWLIGWRAGETDTPWTLFWLRNLGLFIPIAVVLTLSRLPPRRVVRLTLPLWLWFVVPNLISFHPWSGNNSKFLLFWHLAGCVLIATAVGRAWRRWPKWRPVAGLIVLSLVVTGGLDTVRAMQRSTAIPWADAADVNAADWLRSHASRGDVLVYGISNTSAIAAMGGVPAVSGFGGWTADLGIVDAGQRVDASVAILRGDPRTDQLVAAYGVTWVAIGPVERSKYGASDAYWDEHGVLGFSQGEYRIYRTHP